MNTFIDEFFTALQTTLRAYPIPEEAIINAKEEAKQLIVGKEEHKYQLNSTQQAWRKKVAELQEDRVK